VLSLIDHSGFRLYTSPTCLAIAFYFSEKKSGTLMAKQKIGLLAQKINITPTDRDTVLQVFKNKSINDFEGGLQYYAAVRAKCTCIITEDRDDFHFSELEVLGAKDFLSSTFFNDRR
jgi:hypothetical protein